MTTPIDVNSASEDSNSVAPLPSPTTEKDSPQEEAPAPSISTPSAAASPSHSALGSGRSEKQGKWKNYNSNSNPNNGNANGRHYSGKTTNPPPTNCIVLKNLDYHITQPSLEEVVRQVTGGRKNFVNVTLLDDKNTGTFRGMAFVNFHSVPDATAALTELSKMVINDRKVIAEYRRLRPGELERKEAKEKAIREARETREARQREKREREAAAAAAAEAAATSAAEIEETEATITVSDSAGSGETSAGGNVTGGKSSDAPVTTSEAATTPVVKIASSDVAGSVPVVNDSATAEVLPAAKQMDKRALFFASRDNAREITRETKRDVSPEQTERDKVREAEFRKLLIDYAGGNLEDPATMKPDLVFDSSLTSYERRMVHMICNELRLGHVSRQDEDGNRVLHVTKDLERAAEWEKEAVAAGQVPHQKKKERNLKGKETGKQKVGDRANDSSAFPGTVEPLSREERAGIKWFKPKAAKTGNTNGEKSAVAGIQMPKFKVYTPDHKPIGPDGTTGFTSRLKYHGIEAPKKHADDGGDDVVDENVNGSESAAHNYTPKRRRNKRGNNSNKDNNKDSSNSNKGEAQAKPKGNNGLKERKKSGLNPSVPAYSPCV